MRLGRIEILIYLLIVLFISGCGLKTVTPTKDISHGNGSHDEAEASFSTPKAASEPISKAVTPGMVEEYAKIHQISNLKTAEFYLTHPDYAKEHPYAPTEEDVAFYEKDFLERVYPGFKELAAKKGFKEARRIYMSNRPDGPGSRIIGSAKYSAAIQKFASGTGEGALTEALAVENILLGNDQVAVHYREAMKLYSEKHLDDAIKQMEIAVNAKPDAPSILYNLGVMYMEKGDYAKATQSLQTCIENIKSTAYTKANLAMYSEVYVGASTNLGFVYTQLGMYNEAVKVLKEAIQFRPSDPDANRNLGTAYYFMGDMEKTAEQMRKCVKLDPDDAEVHNIIGLIYSRKEFYDAALDEFKTAAKLNPKATQYSYNEGLVLAKLGRVEEANEAFKRAEGLADRTFAEQTMMNKARELYNDGYTAMKNHNLTQAIDLFNAALKIKPDIVEAHINLGVCYRMQGDRQKQMHHFEEAVRLKPDMPDVRYNLGLAYSEAGMYPQAIAEFDRAVELNASFKDAYFQLGMALYKTKRVSDAAAEFGRCLRLSPGWFEAHLNLGSCYLKTGNVAGAISHFEKALQLKPGSAEANYDLGTAYMRAEKYNEAYTLLQKALEIDPAHRQARIMLKELEIYRGK